jgi:hypothetical protein
MAIHHNTLKRATRNGIELVEKFLALTSTTEFRAMKDGVELARGAVAKDVLEQAIEKLNGAAKPARKSKAQREADEDEDYAGEGDDFEEDEVDPSDDEEEAEEEVEDSEGATVVKKKYKDAYRPHRMTCGDDLSTRISNHVMVVDEETGERRIDQAKLRRFAIANEVWVQGYASLNVGMRRMNVANRLRAKVRKGYKVKWEG